MCDVSTGGMATTGGMAAALAVLPVPVAQPQCG